MITYSKATGGFYDSKIHVENMPDDAVEITAAEHSALLTAQSQGKRITVDASGRPIAIAPPQPSIEQQIASALANTYADVDAIYAAAIGGRAPEYEQAEQAAIAFQSAGYTGTASPYVADFAATAGITDRQSADLIIARANGLRAAVLAMRSTRFTAQSAMRAATTQAELDAAVAAWAAFIAQVRASLGL